VNLRAREDTIEVHLLLFYVNKANEVSLIAYSKYIHKPMKYFTSSFVQVPGTHDAAADFIKQDCATDLQGSSFLNPCVRRVFFILFNVLRRVIVLSCGGGGFLDHVCEDDWTMSLQTTMITSCSQLLELCTHFSEQNKDLVHQSLAMLLFIAIEKATTGGCIKIIWRIIRRMVQIYSVGGCCSFTLH